MQSLFAKELKRRGIAEGTKAVDANFTRVADSRKQIVRPGPPGTREQVWSYECRPKLFACTQKELSPKHIVYDYIHIAVEVAAIALVK